MERYPVYFVMLIASVAVPSLGELFSSMAHLQTALYAERDIATEIREYVFQEKERLKKLEAIAEEFERHSGTALQDPDFYLGNPVNAYLFVKHFTLDWDRDIAIALKNNSREELNVKVQELKQHLPTYEDLTGSVNALLRLQDTYKLDTSEIAQGNVGGTKSSELSAAECFEVGRQAYLVQDYYHTVKWMQEAYDRSAVERNKTVSPSSVLDFLTYALYKQGNIRRALTLTNELLEIEPEHSRAQSNKVYYQKIIYEEEKNSYKRGDDGEIVNQRQIDEYRSGPEFQTYEALCRGENIKENKYKDKLVCRYRNNNNPLLILSPAKEEEIYKKPYISLFHDAIRDSEIQQVKNIAIPKLGRATVHNPKTGKLETATYRVSKSCWLSNTDSEGIGKINNRIQAITGLEMSTAEELQVANYGIGGQYEPHFDFARREEPNAFQGLGTGNRIATFMFYMSDVQAGGATVFPYLGLKIFPQKGTAVFWYNLFRSGEGIYDTRHAACPVLVGSKWVSNKWIHERGQEFRYQCGLTAQE